jgi:hypothetical protein
VRVLAEAGVEEATVQAEVVAVAPRLSAERAEVEPVGLVVGVGAEVVLALSSQVAESVVYRV